MNWRALDEHLREETHQIWIDEPHEITLIKNGLIFTGAGSNGQYFSVLVHLEGYLAYLGPHVVYRFLLLSQNHEISLSTIREMTTTMLSRPFDVFRLLGDMGLRRAQILGACYLDALSEIETREDYIALTSALLTYLNRLYQWVHFIFPWSIGAVFPTQQPSDISQQALAIRLWEQNISDDSAVLSLADHLGTTPTEGF